VYKEEQEYPFYVSSADPLAYGEAALLEAMRGLTLFVISRKTRTSASPPKSSRTVKFGVRGFAPLWIRQPGRLPQFLIILAHDH